MMFFFAVLLLVILIVLQRASLWIIRRGERDSLRLKQASIVEQLD
jgi:hypothetical protein